MSKNIGWLGKLTAAVSTTFLMACGSAPQQKELPGILIAPASSAPETGPNPLNPSICREDFPEVLTHKDLNSLLMGGEILLDPKASPKEIQAAAKKKFEERSVLFQKIFGCNTPQSTEMNLAAQLLSINFYDIEAFRKLQNLIVVNNYADVAKYYSPEYFQKEIRAKIGEELRPYADSIQKIGLSLGFEKLEAQLNDVVHENYGKMVSMALKADLARLFGRNTPDEVLTFDKFMQKKIEDVIKTEITEQLEAQKNKFQNFPHYYEEPNKLASKPDLVI